MRIAFGCDHRALLLKIALMSAARGVGHDCEDLGTHDEAPVDYPDIAHKVGQSLVGGGCDKGVLICGTGIGMSMAANKIEGVRAALCHDTFTARRSREHNDANILCLGAEVVNLRLGKEILETFLNTAFEGGRHARRLEKLSPKRC
ncbi:MAG: ribose 5-phosphate isomerase B [Chloroflexi bacterium]|nr:ribose 5-phosphate isomerase B [Chloroflexota bacterium]